MAVTPTFTGTVPTVGGSADTWGSTLNVGLGQIKVDIDALATQGNTNETAANGALPKTGGTATGDIVLANVAPGSPLSAGYRGLPVVSIDADRTLLAADSAKMIRLFGSTSRVWTIPPNTFQTGTVIVLRSFSTGIISVARGAGVELIQPGARVDANRSIASFGEATLKMEDPNIWVISGTGVS